MHIVSGLRSFKVYNDRKVIAPASKKLDSRLSYNKRSLIFDN